MHRFLLLAVLAAAPTLSLHEALARADSRSDKPPAAPTAPPQKPATLESLFERLAAAKDETEARGVAQLIERRWSRSGSDTADLLMSRAAEAIQAKEHALAVELLDRVLSLKPDWPEAWNKRALAFYLLDDPVSSIADINRTLSLEPRHFGAWAGLGHIYMAGGDKRRALDSYRRALAIHPHLDKMQELIERLTPEIDGRDI